MHLKRHIYIILIFFSSISKVEAQDPQFSMFYSVPLYLNPAFAGSRHANRALLHHRWQWPNQDARYTTTQFSFDTYSNKYNSGFGLMALQDYQGGNNIISTHISAMYSYELHLTSRYTLRFGIQGGFIQKQLNVDGPLPSGIDNNGINESASFRRNKLYPDISSGLLFYDRNLWVSLSAHHLNQPNESMIQGTSRLAIKYTLTGGYKIPITLNASSASSGKRGLHGAPDQLYLTPTFTYKHQEYESSQLVSSGADQLDLGLYVTRKWFITGVWYRGIPFKQTDGFRNNESVVFLVGVGYQGFGFGYAYDLTVSSQGTRTGGSHELNLTYVFRINRKKGPARSLPCPDFEYEILRKASQ